MSGSYLYEDVDGVYLQPTDSRNPSSNGAQLGLAGLNGRYSERYQHVSILGYVQDCEEVRACALASAGPDEIVFVTGYCHSYNGAHIAVARLRKRKGEPFERQMGAAARPGYGDLAPAPEDWLHRAKVDALASEFLEAVRSKDRDKLLQLHFDNAGLKWEDDKVKLIRFLLEDRRSPFADFRRRSDLPQRQILVERDLLESRDERDADNYSSVVCFCREDDCTDRWPIATFDADNLPVRPYVCTTIGPYWSHRDGYVTHFQTEIRRFGLAEPKRRR